MPFHNSDEKTRIKLIGGHTDEPLDWRYSFLVLDLISYNQAQPNSVRGFPKNELFALFAIRTVRRIWTVGTVRTIWTVRTRLFAVRWTLIITLSRTLKYIFIYCWEINYRDQVVVKHNLRIKGANCLLYIFPIKPWIGISILTLKFSNWKYKKCWKIVSRVKI